MFAVGADAADARGEMDDDVRTHLGQQPPDVLAAAQIVLLAAGHDDRRRTARPQFADHDGPEKTGAAGDDDALAAPELQATRPVSIGRHEAPCPRAKRCTCCLNGSTSKRATAARTAAGSNAMPSKRSM